MGEFLIDNNVISNYFSNNYSKEGMKFIGEVFDQIPLISVITEIEALSWVNPDKKKEIFVREFIKDAKILALTPDVATSCIRLRRSRKIRIPDAIIAATALIYELKLITSDSDFNNIPGLQIINPNSI